MKKILALVLALIMVLSMVGCSGSKGGSSELGLKVVADSGLTWDTSKEDTIVLTVMANYYESAWKMMAEEYNKLHPETEVIIDVAASNDALFQKFATWFSNPDDLSQAADITHINFCGNVGGTSVLLERDQIYNFEDLRSVTNPYTGKAVDACMLEEDISGFTNENGIYALPFDHVAVAIMTNVDLLKEHGQKVPTTYEEMLDVCAALRAGGIETPILATAEGGNIFTALGDAAYRDMYDQVIIQPTDGNYDEATMSANATYKYDPNDPGCDLSLKTSGERTAILQKELGLKTERNIATWEKIAGMLQYVNENYEASASTEILTSFEMQNGAFLVSGSWNVGVLNKDVQEMGEDGFEWITIPFPSFETTPEHFATNKVRSLYVLGNNMGIIKSRGNDTDHLNRVLDFYMFCYNPVGCAAMYEKTLADGYFVQGNPAIQGVELPEDVSAKLDGFYQEAPMQSYCSGLLGNGIYLTEDKGAYVELVNKLIRTEISVEDFLDELEPIWMRKIDDNIEVNGYDMDPATKDEHK